VEVNYARTSKKLIRQLAQYFEAQNSASLHKPEVINKLQSQVLKGLLAGLSSSTSRQDTRVGKT